MKARPTNRVTGSPLVIKENEVLVRVQATAINAGDYFSMKGSPWLIRMTIGFPKPKNYILGWDVAGHVEEVGKKVTRFQPGDEVFGACEHTFAEYVSANADHLAIKPANLSFEQAATVPTAALTALIGDKETLGVNFKWGDYKSYMNAIELIACHPNDFYKALAKGVEYASSKYGGKDFALSFGSNEMPGYHTGPMCYVGYLTGSRHSHLDSAGYSLDQKNLANGKVPNQEEDVKKLFAEEVWRQVLNSLVICLFARNIYTKKIILKSLEISGINVDENDLDRIGFEILRNKLRFKLREGFDPENLRIPKRIFETETPVGIINDDFLKKSVKDFFNLLLYKRTY